MLDDLIERFVNAFHLARDCWKILCADLSLLLLPLFSGVACILVMLSFIAPQSLDQEGILAGIVRLARLLDVETNDASWKSWGTIFLFYFCLNFIIFYFNAALVHCCLFRLRGIPVNLFHGLLAATRRLPQLLAWSVVSATVGLVIRIVERAGRHQGQSRRYFLIQIFGVLWSVATYFIVPVLVIERVGPLKAFKRSVKVLTRTWGDQIEGRVGIDFCAFPIWLIGFVMLGFGIKAGVTTSSINPVLVGLGILWLLTTALIHSTLDTVLLSALYLYSTQDEIPAQWEAAQMEQAFYARTTYTAD
jgi:hypothetical protein